VINQSPKPVEVVEGISPDAIPSWVFEREEPLVLRGLVADWPAIPEGDGDLEQLEACLSKFWTAKPVTAYVAPTEVAGRFGYNGAFNGFNFRSGNAPLEDILQRLREQADPENKEPLSIYVGSTPIAGWLPGFEKANALKIPGDPLVNFWLGNRTTVSAHYDFPSNVACVVYGRREFTLFPTDQIGNLYVGPLDRTPSGQPISLVDFDAPDFDKFPRFRKAMAASQRCELGPGDAIFIPSMWWHHVKAMSDCNLLVNYWWLDHEQHFGSPFNALLHGVLSIRHLPEAQRLAWQKLMNFYVFESDAEATDHIPEHALGCLGEMNKIEADRLREELLNRLKI